jgi:hypothetical protein
MPAAGRLLLALAERLGRDRGRAEPQHATGGAVTRLPRRPESSGDTPDRARSLAASLHGERWKGSRCTPPIQAMGGTCARISCFRPSISSHTPGGHPL